MSAPTILLLGSKGQVGWELQRSLAPLGRVVALDRHSREHCGDLSDLDGLKATVRALRPVAIVNAAAHTAVDRAESESELAQLINALAPQALAEAASEVGAWLLHTAPTMSSTAAASSPGRKATRPARSISTAAASSRANA